ncbi:hypothetical protein FJT64_015151 [Amphibalanus amphitrite]|uniref:Uncharacterized protein n=1 Tax=Amphibalanus amphitrite TaxID=1232801 RepID=A0A6A4X819_AMPAM|nr:hypothetical protein FJT64_015151 [Amphibalanus amphitrite]
MAAVTRTLAVLLAALAAAAAAEYTDTFAICVDGHDESHARQIAEKHGFELLHQVTFVEQQKAKRRVKRDHVEPTLRHRRRTRDGRHQRAPIYRSTYLNDPSWPRMWYLLGPPWTRPADPVLPHFPSAGRVRGYAGSLGVYHPLSELGQGGSPLGGQPAGRFLPEWSRSPRQVLASWNSGRCGVWMAKVMLWG